MVARPRAVPFLQFKSRNADHSSEITIGGKPSAPPIRPKYLRMRSASPQRVSIRSAVGRAQLLQPLQERREAGGGFGIVRRQIHERADAAYPLALAPRAPRAAAPPRRRAVQRSPAVRSFDHLVGDGE